MGTQRRFIIIGIVVTIFALIVFTLAVFKFGWDWTGFTGGESNITITSTSKGITTAKELQPAKTFWDWLELLGVLAIPIVVGFGAAWFTRAQQLRDQEHEKLQRERDQEAARIQHDRDQQLADQRAESERKAAEQQAELERELTRDNQRESLLQAYIDKMSELLLESKLRESTEDDEVRKIARVRTITVLNQLDARRVGYVFTFLQEARLMLPPTLDSSTPNSDVVSLKGADFSGVKWGQASLAFANLSGAQFRSADLSSAFLMNANLSGAHLLFADLSSAFLERADLSEASLDGAHLSEARLLFADLHQASLSDANLSFANLSDADLSGAKLYRADLRGADLIKADLRGAYLNNANLSGAHFLFTDLSLDLSGADLSGADLSGADLSGAEITEGQLNQAKLLKDATMPDGSKHP